MGGSEALCARTISAGTTVVCAHSMNEYRVATSNDNANSQRYFKTLRFHDVKVIDTVQDNERETNANVSHYYSEGSLLTGEFNMESCGIFSTFFSSTLVTTPWSPIVHVTKLAISCFPHRSSFPG